MTKEFCDHCGDLLSVPLFVYVKDGAIEKRREFCGYRCLMVWAELRHAGEPEERP